MYGVEFGDVGLCSGFAREEEVQEAGRAVEAVAPDKNGERKHAAEFPDPEFGAAGEGEPVGSADLLLFGAALAPDVEAPTAEGPVEGVGEVPDAVEEDVADEGGGV